MPDPITGLVVGGTSLIGGAIKSSAAKKAGQLQADASMMGVEETRRQFDAMRELLAPYVENGLESLPGIEPYLDAGTGSLPTLETFLRAGEGALGDLEGYAAGGRRAFDEQLAITGLAGPEAQLKAMQGIEGSPIFQALAMQGEDAILQNASATGGLRGGNVQGALAQFRPAMLNQFIEQQYGRLGGIAGAGLGVSSDLTTMGAQGRQNLVGIGAQGIQNMISLGQNSAAGTGNAGMQAGANIAQLLGEAGAARAGARLGSASAWGDVLSLPAKFAGLKYAGAF